MLPIHSILASGNPVLDYLPYILIGICALVLVLGFIHGFKRGFRLVSWNGLVWVIASAAFFLLARKFKENNPLSAPFVSLGEQTAANLGMLLLAVGCVAGALVLYALVATLFRPRRESVMSEDERKLYANYGVEYDDLRADYDDYKRYAPVVKAETRMIPPSGVGRVLGGLFAMLNVAAFLIAIAVVGLLVIDGTAIKNYVPALYEVTLGETLVMEKCLQWIANYGLDFLFIGITVATAFSGKQRGLLESLRRVLIRWVGVAAIALALYLPFSQYAADPEGLIGSIILKISSIMPESLGAVGGYLSLALTSILFVIAVVLVRFVLNLILKVLVKCVRRTPILRKVDGALSCLAYVLVGVLVCAILWAVLYLIEYYGVFSTSSLFSENATISQGLFALLDTYFKPLIDGFMGGLQGILSSLGLA